jgi:hypothetical protein
LGVPFHTTLHNRLDTPGLPDVVHQFPDAPFISISNDQRVPLPGAYWLETIYHNGLPPDALRLRSALSIAARKCIDVGPPAC